MSREWWKSNINRLMEERDKIFAKIIYGPTFTYTGGTMGDKEMKSTGMAFIEMYRSLQDAIDNAGGAIGWLTPDSLDGLSVSDLFTRLATNGVRFYCNKTHFLEEFPKPSIDPRYMNDKEEKITLDK